MAQAIFKSWFVDFEQAAKALGKDMVVTEMVRCEVGEGIEKKEENFAAEVAAQMNK